MLHWLPGVWLCIYLAGLLWSIALQVRASLRWHALLLASCASAQTMQQVTVTAIKSAEREQSARTVSSSGRGNPAPGRQYAGGGHSEARRQPSRLNC